MEISQAEHDRRIEHEENIARGGAGVEEAGGNSEAPAPAGSEISSDILSDALDRILAESKPRKQKIHVSQEAKEVIGTLAHFQSQESAAALFDVTQPVASMARRGLKGGTALDQQVPNPDLKEAVESNVLKIVELSSNVAVRSLTKITDDKLDKLNALGLARVAKEMAQVSRDSSPSRNVGGNSQVVIIAQPGRNLSDYETVDVKFREMRT